VILAFLCSCCVSFLVKPMIGLASFERAMAGIGTQEATYSQEAETVLGPPD